MRVHIFIWGEVPSGSSFRWRLIWLVTLSSGNETPETKTSDFFCNFFLFLIR